MTSIVESLDLILCYVSIFLKNAHGEAIPNPITSSILGSQPHGRRKMKWRTTQVEF
jgi:hypothetical protein